MIRILHELGSLDGGGVARLLYDYYVHMDQGRIHFDFLIYDYYEEGILEKPLKDLGCQIFKVPKIQDGKEAFLKGIDSTISKNHFDVVHSHRGPQSYYVLSAARKHGISVRIAHAHLAYKPENFSRYVKESILLALDKHIATSLFACGQEAGKSMWKSGIINKPFYLMKNAINLERFVFSNVIRNQKRAELGITPNEYVFGIVGRLEDQKNHEFLLRAVRELVNRTQKFLLLVVGRGTLDEKMSQLSAEWGLKEHVRFLGVRSDVNEILSALDCFVLPSKYEGLPVVLVEAQANGLPILASDQMTKEMAVTDLITFIPISNPAIWADQMMQKTMQSHRTNRTIYASIMKNNGYSIQDEAIKLFDKYTELLER